MSRPALLAVFAILLVGGCRTTADADQVGSPGDSVAGTETTHGKGPATVRPSTGAPSSSSALGSTLVAVATVNAGDVLPCERVCGSLGDCLLTDDDYTAPVAGGLEFQCLDMCVHSPDTARAKTEFLACGAKAECGQLQACAERNWTALAEARRSPEFAGVAAVADDPCKSGCRWFFACVMTGRPPGEAYLEPQMEQGMNECINQCDNIRGPDHDRIARLATCVPSRCSSEEAYTCLEP